MTSGKTAVSTHLMFQGDAKAAIELYKSVFPEFSVASMELYADGEAGAAGLVKEARATFCGHVDLCRIPGRRRVGPRLLAPFRGRTGHDAAG